MTANRWCYACFPSSGTVARAVLQGRRKGTITGLKCTLARPSAGRRTWMAGRSSRRFPLVVVRRSPIHAINGFARRPKAMATARESMRRHSPKEVRSPAFTIPWSGNLQTRVCLESNGRTSTPSGATSAENAGALSRALDHPVKRAIAPLSNEFRPTSAMRFVQRAQSSSA
eukprot:COSAG02_NODE_7_length_64539_cov_120.393482_54_plen_171_part_00